MYGGNTKHHSNPYNIIQGTTVPCDSMQCGIEYSSSKSVYVGISIMVCYLF